MGLYRAEGGVERGLSSDKLEGLLFAAFEKLGTRSDRVGYELIRVPLHGAGHATGEYEEFKRRVSLPQPPSRFLDSAQRSPALRQTRVRGKLCALDPKIASSCFVGRQIWRRPSPILQ